MLAAIVGVILSIVFFVPAMAFWLQLFRLIGVLGR